MKREEILKVIEELSHSQGFYSRLYRELIDLKENNIEDYNNVMNALELENFKDSVDLILYLET